MNQLESRLNVACDRVLQSFPFTGYVGTGTIAAVRTTARTLSRFLPDWDGKHLLDIGCGPMEKTAILQLSGFQCCAVDDLSDPWHRRDDNEKKIHAFADSVGIDFEQQQMGDHTIPFQVGSFDVVCSFAVLEHLHESPRSLLNTMGTYLKPEGLLVITMPNSVNLRKRLSVTTGRTNYVPVDQFFHSNGIWRGHVREYTLSETEYICREAGFDVLASTTFENLAQDRLRFPMRQLYMAIGSVVPSTRSSLLVVARKPANWQPLEYDADTSRKTIANSVPLAVR